jgi:hypothetical protein
MIGAGRFVLIGLVLSSGVYLAGRSVRADAAPPSPSPDLDAVLDLCQRPPQQADCRERMELVSLCFEKLDRKVDQAADDADNAAANVDRLTKLIEQNPAADAGAIPDAGTALNLDALRTALDRARAAAKDAQERWNTERERRSWFTAQAGSTCVPADAIDVMASAASGAGSAYQWSLDASWRHRLAPRLASELALGRSITTRGVFADDRASWGDGIWKAGVRLRHGRGNLGDFYWGPSLAFGKRDDAWDLLAVGAQIGYSFSPEREHGDRVGSDFRLFVEPWFPTSGRGGIALFGFGGGISAFAGRRCPHP